MPKEQRSIEYSRRTVVKFHAGVTLLLLHMALSNAQIVQTLQIDFEKTTIKKGKQEVVCGTIFYQHPDGMCMMITDPVNQWVFSGKDSMVLYYPEDSLAFKFRTLYPVTFPFFQAFLGIVQEDYGLSSIGYTLSEHEVHDGMLTTTWTPPDEAPDDIGSFRITYANDRLMSAAYESGDGTVISSTLYRNHCAYGAYFFPLEIEKTQVIKQDTIFETIRYARPDFNCVLPDTLINFRLPEHVTTEPVQWQ